jgi:general secretion pathway protein G
MAADVAQRHPDINHMLPTTLASKLTLTAKIALFDVREPREFAISHLAHAVLVPPRGASALQIVRDTLAQRPEVEWAVFYCAVGVRSSALASQFMHGSANRDIGVANLAGGLFRWANEGRPLVNEHGPTTTVHPFNRHWGRFVLPIVASEQSGGRAARSPVRRGLLWGSILALVTALLVAAYPHTQQPQKSRTIAAKVQIMSVSTALEMYAADVGAFPSQQQGLAALLDAPATVSNWRGPYMKSHKHLIDPWGRPFTYRRSGSKGLPDVSTLGRDNAPGGTGEDTDITSDTLN